MTPKDALPKGLGRIGFADRAAHEPSQSLLSRPVGEHPLRGALRDPLGNGFMALFALVIWAALMVTP